MPRCKSLTVIPLTIDCSKGTPTTCSSDLGMCSSISFSNFKNIQIEWFNLLERQNHVLPPQSLSSAGDVHKGSLNSGRNRNDVRSTQIDAPPRWTPLNSFDNSLIDCRRSPNKDANLRCWLWSHSFSKQFYKIILWSNFEQLRWLAEEKNFKFSNEEFKRLRWANQKEPQKDELLFCVETPNLPLELYTLKFGASLSLSLASEAHSKGLKTLNWSLYTRIRCPLDNSFHYWASNTDFGRPANSPKPITY